jgi:hypothetical protein
MLLEGLDDEHVFKHFCGVRGLGQIDVVKQHGGIDPLLEALPLRLIESNVRAIGVVVDADLDVSGRWDAVRSRLVTAGYASVPLSLPEQGLVLSATESLPRIGVWIMPSNQVPGMIEDFLAALVDPGDELLASVRTFLSGLSGSNRRFAPKDLPKALIHTWLAVQENPGRPMGQAITHRYFDVRNPAGNAFFEWICSVFMIPTTDPH